MKELALILHFIGLAMGLGTSIGFIFLGKAGAKLPPEEGQKFMMNAFALSRMGHIGLVLLVLSGGYMVGNNWGAVGSNTPFLIKLILVAVLAILVLVLTQFANQAKQGKPENSIKYNRILGMVSVLTGLSIVVFAVLAFH